MHGKQKQRTIEFR